MIFNWLIFIAKAILWALVALTLAFALLSFIAACGINFPSALTIMLTCGNILVSPTITAPTYAFFVCGLTWMYTALAMIMPSAVSITLYDSNRQKHQMNNYLLSHIVYRPEGVSAQALS